MNAENIAETTEAYGEWEHLLLENPKVLWGLIGDVVKAIKAGEGERRTGRRPAASVGSLDELYALLFPPVYTIYDFPTALLMALGKRSQASLAITVGMSQPTISRFINGQKVPTLREMEILAAGLNVRPTYFREYRAQRIGQIVTDVLNTHPHMSADSVRNLVGARR